MDHRAEPVRNTFSGLTLNRKPAGPDAATDWQRTLHAGLCVVVRGDDILFDPAGDGPLLLNRRMLRDCAADPRPLFLGHDGETGYFVLDLAQLPESSGLYLSTLGVFAALRRCAAILPAQTAALLGYARAVSGWHARSRFCPGCGHPTRPRANAQGRICSNPDCGQEHFPRVDPAVIVLVHDGDRCLLGRQAAWRPRVYSALAGYVEPGESAEDAVAREIREEAGIEVDDVRYHSSQPWPFSGALMLGFHARAVSTRITLGDRELEDAGWFSRRDISILVQSGELCLPAGETIARRLLDAWLPDPDGIFPAP